MCITIVLTERVYTVDDTFLGDAEVMRRSHSAEANTRGYPDPVITKEGNMILDLFFYEDFKLFGESVDYDTFQSTLMKIPGVVSSGVVAVPTSANRVIIASTCKESPDDHPIS